ncbi:feruloyl-CoA synthase [Sulfuritalea hydrogenivorans]|uniref:Feruloyl-CoA synthase n=1 Tax=Sulfuritalea hydrogenivorans sk43H TaxID=1223802 RepID=W0SDA1_9PROT|nr:feruloyl-CoA synthase [Sulfuritalea hydrogenivorans]MDK9713019.1 feruloyl-CoA synthase [Sulfuritalea sp.]BAO29031.1 feruloyl-CoA synthase [Sulfuritalea hydrogenivorans sk43H]
MSPIARKPAELFVDPAVILEARPDGSRLFRSALTLPDYSRCSGEWLERWAGETPDAVLIAERGLDGEWVKVTYGQALTRVYRIATWLLGQNLSPERPVLVLSDNGIEHALLMLACLHVGVPISPVSPGNSLLSRDFLKLKANVELLRPGVIFADSIERFLPALNAIAGLHDGVVVAGSRSQPQPGTLPFADIEKVMRSGIHSDGADDTAVKAAFAAITPDTIAKFLFTSGSVGAPKAVITTQRMMCSNVEMKSVIWPFLNTQKPVICDWLPWSHVFGGSHNFNKVLRFGGSLYIDDGKPLPALLPKTVRNLTDISPTIYFSVPLAYALLVAELRDNAALRKSFFSRLQIIFYAGAALPQSTWDELERLAVMELGHPVVMLSSWGSTETAPACTDCHFQAVRSGVIGVPIPGTTLKLVPVADKLEVRVKGPNLFPGYWKQPALTKAAFDEEGFYMIGDAVSFVDPAKPEQGLLFDGRVAEDFKLLSGTWVHVGSIRVAGISALSPIAQDIVLTGHDRDDIGFLVFPNIAECRRLASLGDDAPAATVIGHPVIKERMREGLMRLKQQGGGSSTYPTRALLMAEPPSSEHGELTDKGYINQRAVLTRRADRVLELYSDVPDAAVIFI